MPDLFEAILGRLDKVSKPASNGDRMARCPMHEDRTPSLSVHPERGFKCHGCNRQGSLADLGEQLGIPIARKGLGEAGALRALQARGLSTDTLSAFGIEADLNAQAWRYPIRDQAGRAVAHRFKAFNAQRRRKFWWGDGPRLAIYGLDTLADRFPQTATVCLVEGEPDVWMAHECGIPALSFTDGAGHVPAGAAFLLRSLGIQHVEIIYDNDDAGRRGAQTVARALGKDLSVSVVSLPTELGIGGDLTDLYKLVGQDAKALRQALEHLPRVDLSEEEKQDIGTPASIARKQLAPLNPWLAEGIMRRGELAVLSGRADSFKSTFALELAITVVSGQPFLGEMASGAQGPVIYVQEEIHPNFFNYRLANATEGLDDRTVSKLLIWNRRGLVLGRDSGSLERLLQAIELAQPLLVIIDNLTCCYPPGFGENDAAAMTQLLEPLKRVRDEREVGILLIHHDRKPGAFEGSESPRGSSVLENAPDCRLRLLRDPNRRDRDWVECHARLRNGGAAEPFWSVYAGERLRRREP